MIFKRGFTISEIVVALAIIGIIAAIIIPQVATGINRQQVGPTLGRSLEQIETGCQDLVHFINSRPAVAETGSLGSFVGDFTIRDLNGGDNDSQLPLANNFIDIIVPYMGLQELPNGINNIDNATAAMNAEFADSERFKFKKFQAWAYIFHDGNMTADDIARGEDDILRIFIDTNGEANPNVIGNDIYYFHLRNNCKLVPMEDSTRDIVNRGFKL